MKKRFLCLLLAAAVCFSFAACAEAEDAARGETENLPAVYVESEFAPLKKVIVSQSEFTDSILPVSRCYVPIENVIASGGELRDGYIYNTVDQRTLDRMTEEREELCAVLEKYGVEVLRPRKLTEKEMAQAVLPEGASHGKGLSNFFVRDPFIVVGDHVIEANFRKEYRRFEALTARDIFLGKSSSYVGLPMADISDSERGPFLEGGDVIVYHKQVFVGNSGFASNSEGIQWLRDYLAPYGYEVIEVKLQGHILHLDCALSLVREGLMIVCEESFVDGIPEAFKDWDRISVSEIYAMNMAVNGLPVSPEVYITDIVFKNSVGKELEARGVKVEYLDQAATRSYSGSVHCSTQPVLRIDE